MDPTPDPTPPDASLLKGFWARSGAASAVFSTYEVVAHFLTPWLVSVGGEAGAVLVKATGVAWLVALGFTRASPSAKVE